MAKPHYYVYVVLLNPLVREHAKFLRANTAYREGLPCVYVGMTGLEPDTRFDKHKAGIQANRYVRDYGERLMPELVDDLRQPMTYDDAAYLEVDVAIRLRAEGFGVWQG